MTSSALTPELDQTRTIPPANEPFRPGRHIAALDGLRGIAVLLVMTFHYFEPLYEENTTFSKVLYKFTHFGWCGVDLFFVLSGFLITGILFDSKSSKQYFRNFYTRRTLRIFPLYYAVLIVCFLIIPLFVTYKSADAIVAAHQLSLWLYYANVDIARHGWVLNGDHLNMSHFWSLAVEEQFYLIWPFVVLLCTRRGLMKVCIACVVGALLMRMWIGQMKDGPLIAYMLTPCRLDTLAWGGLAAMAIRGPGGIQSSVRPAKIILLISGVVLFSLAAVNRYFSPFAPFVLTAGFSALAAFFASLLILAIVSSETSWFGRFYRFRLLRATGKIAYGLYVYHYLIHPFLEKIIPAARHHMPFPLAALVYLLTGYTAAFLISIISWNLFEKHFLPLKDWLAPPAPQA